jgi:hypothetical protein
MVESFVNIRAQSFAYFVMVESFVNIRAQSFAYWMEGFVICFKIAR